MLQQVNKDNFTDIVENHEVVLLDFYADWCGPCKALHPALESVSQTYDGLAAVAKVNVDQNPELSAKFGVRSIPALFYLKNGKIVGKQVGAQPEQVLASTLDDIINN